jgi:hypothetical protein
MLAKSRACIGHQACLRLLPGVGSPSSASRGSVLAARPEPPAREAEMTFSAMGGRPLRRLRQAPALRLGRSLSGSKPGFLERDPGKAPLGRQSRRGPSLDLGPHHGYGRPVRNQSVLSLRPGLSFLQRRPAMRCVLVISVTAFVLAFPSRASAAWSFYFDKICQCAGTHARGSCWWCDCIYRVGVLDE